MVSRLASKSKSSDVTVYIVKSKRSRGKINGKRIGEKVEQKNNQAREEMFVYR